MERRKSREVSIGSVTIGGNHPVAVQSMTNTKTENIAATVDQIHRLTERGCILFGMVGGLFAYFLKHTKAFVTNKITNPYKRIFMMGIIVAILLFVFGKCRYSGVGENLIVGSFTSEKIYSYDWILKFILTILTLSAGFQGGEVTPLFAIGSSLGVIIAPVFGLNPLFVASLGYCSVFGAATNTFLAPIAIGMEVFGYQYFPFFFVVCAISYIVNQNESIYALQRQVRE